MSYWPLQLGPLTFGGPLGCSKNPVSCRIQFQYLSLLNEHPKSHQEIEEDSQENIKMSNRLH